MASVPRAAKRTAASPGSANASPSGLQAINKRSAPGTAFGHSCARCLGSDGRTASRPQGGAQRAQQTMSQSPP
eukprot:1133037-Alexandrium_andersonii.AAC.1